MLGIVIIVIIAIVVIIAAIIAVDDGQWIQGYGIE
jgi:hypothetical protein